MKLVLGDKVCTRRDNVVAPGPGGGRGSLGPALGGNKTRPPITSHRVLCNNTSQHHYPASAPAMHHPSACQHLESISAITSLTLVLFCKGSILYFLFLLINNWKSKEHICLPTLGIVGICLLDPLHTMSASTKVAVFSA